MRKGIKCLIMAAVMMVLTLSTSVTTWADTTEQVAVEISTDKESYENGDKILVTVKVTNNGEEALSDVNVKVNWPEEMSFVNEEDKVLVLDSLAAGESQTFEVEGTKTASNLIFIVVIVAVVIIVVAVVVFLIAKKKKPQTVVAMLVLATALGMLAPVTTVAGEKIDATTTVTIGGTEQTISATVTYNVYYMGRISRVSVHDPSVVYDPESDMYYIFGSHRAWAKSEDLINWKTFTNNINTDFRKLFANEVEWSKKGSASYDVEGNCWAPDVVYNETMGKWCMYMSINGANWYSSIVLLTADSIEGDWTYVGPVVYSGFTTKEEAQETDFYDVYTGTDFPERYNEMRAGNHSYGMNAIDPCVFFDEEGKLWMAYGSWFGGIYMLELDPATGQRLASHTYETVKNESDEYQGIKIAGGNVVSGEGAYIEHIGDYYYLYISYGGLEPDGGYNMRVFRSESPTGPYVDLSGEPAIPMSGNDNINGSYGVRVMSYYQWDYMKYGYIAQGHNSAYEDEDGNIFVVYHSKFTNQGVFHNVQVHQQFVNEDGWLVTAPFGYTGEGLCYVDKEDVVGEYTILVHEIKFNYSAKKCMTTQNIELKEDGTITGDLTGTWEFSESMETPYVTMTIDDVTYKGVFVKQRMDNSGSMAMTFTVLGDDELNIWGYNQIEE